jgi:hypothetical protein
MTTKTGPPDPDEEWARWIAWLGEEGRGPSIWEDVLAMMASRQIWDGLRTVQNQAPVAALKNATFWSWAAENYVRRQALAIRRQVDLDKDVVSLGRLIDQVRRYPHVLSRDRYSARTAGWMTRAQADGFFDEMVGSGRPSIDPDVPRAELAKMKTRTSKIVEWVDNEVAHYNQAKGQFGIGLKYRDLHSAIDLIIDLAVKYRLLILGSSMSKSVAMYPWVHVFRVAWIQSDDQIINGARSKAESAKSNGSARLGNRSRTMNSSVNRSHRGGSDRAGDPQRCCGSFRGQA